MARNTSSSRFSLARSAYRRRDVNMAEEAHTHDYLDQLLREDGKHGKFLADAVLGATDGIVTTFAIVAGAAGAALSPGVVIVMGFANLVADGFSMAVGNYLGAQSQQAYWKEERAREVWEIEHLPEAEREEMRRLYRAKGFEGELLERVVATLTLNKERWVEEMMREELGIQQESLAPWMSGLITHASFVVAGLIPLLCYLYAFFNPAVVTMAFPTSLGLTAGALFAVGAARALMTRRVWWQSGLEILGVGGTATLCAFGVGYLLRGWV